MATVNPILLHRFSLQCMLIHSLPRPSPPKWRLIFGHRSLRIRFSPLPRLAIGSSIEKNADVK